MTENNDKKRFGRRAGATAIWAVCIMETWHVAVFRGMTLDWFTTIAGFLTLGLGVVTGALTITDIVMKKLDILKTNKQ